MPSTLGVADSAVPGESQPRQRHRLGQAEPPAVPAEGRRHRPLREGHRHLGLGQQRRGREPDLVMACAGDIPTLEALAATAMLRDAFPDLKVRFVRGGPLQDAAAGRASARTVRPRL